MSFVVCDGTAHWSKSGRLTTNSDAVRVGIGFDRADPAQIVIACGSVGLPTRLSQTDARPALAALVAIETGVLWPLCRFDSQPIVDILVLFLAAADVQWGRNQLWRLHRAKAEAIGEPLRSP